MADDLKQDLKVLKAFLEKEAQDHVKFCNDMQDRRTAEYKARGDADADYRHLSGIEETKYWPFIEITNRAIEQNDANRWPIQPEGIGVILIESLNIPEIATKIAKAIQSGNY